jgi:phosphatidylglycerophosphate synthase
MVRRALVLVTALRWALEDCAGLPLFKRTLLAAQKGGIEEFYIVARESTDLKPLLQDPRLKSSFRWVEGGLPEAFFKPDSAVLVIKAEAVFDAKVVENALRWELGGQIAHLAVRKGRAERGTFINLDGEKVLGFAEEEADALTAGLLLVKPEALRDITLGGQQNPITFTDLVRHLIRKGTVKAVNVTRELCQEVTSLEALQGARQALYKRLGLPTDGLMATYVNRRLSGLLTRLLVRLPLTPNQITLGSLLIGLVACWFFWQGGYWHSVFAALIYQVSVIVDLSDGEVARLKFMQSHLGAWLDSICDSIVYAGIFLAIALALSRQDHTHVLWAGTAAAISVFICLNLDAYLLMKRDAEGTSNASSSLTDKLANVDTFQIVLFLFIFSGQLLWFIWGMAVGWTGYLTFSLLKLLFGWLRRGRATA